MAKTYSLIQAQTLTSAAATVTFSNIPQNFTDLVLEVSCRSVGVSNENLSVRVNGLTTGYTTKRLYGDGSSTASDSTSGISGNGGSAYLTAALPNANYTSNTFGSIKIILSNYTSSSNKSLTSIGVTENIATQSYLDLESGLLSTSSPITSITFLNYTGSNLAANSTFYLYGIGGTRATGGTITSDNNFTYHTFTSSGTFTALEKINGAEVLMIAGGGSGGKTTDTTSYGSGGGGAGGVFYATRQNLFAGTSYSAIVGAGGSDSNGSNSQFSSLVNAIGGGKGGNASNTAATAGSSGGSGGGGTYQTLAGGSTTQSSTGGIGYGFAGGAGSSINGIGGGGGGAGAVGTAGAGGNNGGNGGIGINIFANWATATGTGVNQYFAGGGAAAGYGNGTFPGGIGGLGGGGKGGGVATGSLIGTAGTANTGGGGGGSTQNYGSVGSAGGAGGSGLVIIRYPNVE